MDPSCAAFGALQPQQQLTGLAGYRELPSLPQGHFLGQGKTAFFVGEGWGVFCLVGFSLGFLVWVGFFPIKSMLTWLHISLSGSVFAGERSACRSHWWVAGGDAEPVWLPGGSALLSPWPEYAPGALLAPAQSRELPRPAPGQGLPAGLAQQRPTLPGTRCWRHRYLRMAHYAQINGLFPHGLPPANVQALLPKAGMSSQLVSPEPPCPSSVLPSVLLQTCHACRSRSRLQHQGSSDAPAPASDRCRWRDPAFCKTLSLGNLPGKTARTGSARVAWLHPCAPTAPSSRSSVSSSLPHPSGFLLVCPFLMHSQLTCVTDGSVSTASLPLPLAFPSERPGDYVLDLLSVPWCDTAACPHSHRHVCGYPQGMASSSNHLVGCW